MLRQGIREEFLEPIWQPDVGLVLGPYRNEEAPDDGGDDEPPVYTDEPYHDRVPRLPGFCTQQRHGPKTSAGYIEGEIK